MEPILSKEEISDLLAAIKTGKVSTDAIDTVSTQSPRLANALEVDLVRAYAHKKQSGENRIPNFDLVLDTFARHFNTGLTNNLQRTFHVERQDIDTSTFQQSLADLNNQGAVGVYSTLPLKHGCIIHFDSLLAFSLLEIMLGSSVDNESLALDRNLTTIEINILKSTLETVATDLKKAFQLVIAFQPELTKVENNFRMVKIVEEDTEVLVAKFSVNINNEPAGQMRFIIPYLTLEPIREKFKEIVSIAQVSHTWGKTLSQEAMEMNTNVVARSGLINMNIREILQLKAGDIIDLGYDPDQPLTILTENRPKFSAVPGVRNGKKAFHVTGRFSNRLGGSNGRI